MRCLRYIALALMVSSFLMGSVYAQEENEDLQAVLDEYVAPDDPAVVIAVTTEEDLWQAAQGLADLEGQTPAQIEDKFRIGSITKPFLAVTMLQLQEEGVLDLDDGISQWLPAAVLAHIPNSEQITLRELLNMTSGIFNYTESDAFYEAVYADITHPWTAAETIAYIEGEAPYFAPGEGWYYSNTNYNLVQIVIETATGQPLADVLKARIFDPLGMDDSYLEPPTVAKDIVRGYTDEDGDGVLDDVTTINEAVGLGDGGIICTAADLAKFPRALFEGDLLSADALAEMMDFIPSDEGDYGLGMGRDETDYGDELGHTGATAGFQSTMSYFPDSGLVVVTLTNNFDSDILGDIEYAAVDALAEDDEE